MYVYNSYLIFIVCVKKTMYFSLYFSFEHFCIQMLAEFLLVKTAVKGHRSSNLYPDIWLAKTLNPNTWLVNDLIGQNPKSQHMIGQNPKSQLMIRGTIWLAKLFTMLGYQKYKRSWICRLESVYYPCKLELLPTEQ